MKPAAVAIFVKTPGLSPIKTRLAAGIGTERAEEFFSLACEAVREVVIASGLDAYWAVAEEEGLPRWTVFPGIAQGSGGLGARLDHVYSALLARHPRVLLIGADSPQLTAERLKDAALLKQFAIGRCPDGGFHLLAGSAKIPRAVWESVPYSVSVTSDTLVARLERLDRVHELPMMVDVDERADLARLELELKALGSPTPAQTRILRWISSNV